MSSKKNLKRQAPLTAESLAWGTAYAMEQAWHLLRDSVLLTQNERHASSLVLATYCLEQLGRAQLYRDYAKRAGAGEQVSLASMERELRNHLPKMHRANIPVTAGAAFFGEQPAPGSEAERQLLQQLQSIRKILENQAPQKALDERQRALHVDRIQYAPGWNRPCRVVTRSGVSSEIDAEYYVSAAAVRYGGLRADLQRDTSDIGEAIWKRIEHLGLPEPPWDIWTWEEEGKDVVRATART